VWRQTPAVAYQVGMRQGDSCRQLLQEFERGEFDTGGAVRPRPSEAVHEIPIGSLFQPLKRQGTAGGRAHQARQLVPPMRWNLGVSV